MTDHKRLEAEEAMHEVTRIAQRQGEIEGLIEEERQEILHQRIVAARAGESPVSSVDRVGLEGLMAERDELPELLFVARIRASGSQIAYEMSVQDELQPQVAEAEAELGPLLEEAARVQARADEAAARLSMLEGAVLASQERAKMHEDLLRTIEAEGPRRLYG